MTIQVLEHLRTQPGEPDLTMQEILAARNFARVVALEDEKASGVPRPPCPAPDMLPPTKAEMREFYDLVWLGQGRHS